MVWFGGLLRCGLEGLVVVWFGGFSCGVVRGEFVVRCGV